MSIGGGAAFNSTSACRMTFLSVVRKFRKFAALSTLWALLLIPADCPIARSQTSLGTPDPSDVMAAQFQTSSLLAFSPK
jgi:hypothetical protein